MPSVALSPEGKVIVVDGKVSCECCPGAAIAITCASKTAEPYLVGWSAYTSPNDGPIYKWKSRTLSGSFDERVTPGSPSTECDREGLATFSGTATRDETGLTASANLHYIDYQEYGPLPCVITSENDYPVTDMVSNESGVWTSVLPGTCSGVNEIRYSVTPTVRTVTRCSGGPRTGSGTETLGDPDTIEAAIARATPTEGTSCCAVTGVIASTSAEDTTPLSVGESTSVTLTITGSGLSPLTSYDITINFTNFIDSDDTPLPDTEETITVETDADGAIDMDYDVPQPGSDRRRCYSSFSYEPTPE